ncbi:serine protease inhibitor Cvsi-2-like [Mya arenaria]|uniref:serine protease inhibitor Cvsi-2-like n=1 Tax=Mya arenaria TaxID=6604 RepID=UPI0022E453EB|nr:serine protease inhibitor Cvsi-2-like [Mya arenaria]
MRTCIVALVFCGLIAISVGEPCQTLADCAETACTHLDSHITCEWPRGDCDNGSCHGYCTCGALTACGPSGDCSAIRCHDQDKAPHCVEGSCKCIDIDN